ncbi:hypothetical protein ASG43_15430 [Aureimonas sp. Leaf454]|uniref:hypothetical protein n=1 Tax=Aureimonas sp. Leaf454 TaxID=1736381 RepID=UPI0006FBDCDB|nr:hypothetical protein [Aureimonas sp. Leaf454]KQT42942.1 hypothetical protein ASG43_15430 [Aureimonas sp. Leaf454]
MTGLTAALALLFFAPLAFVYGRHVAHGLHRAAAATGRPVLRLATGRILRAALVVLALVVAVTSRETIAAELPAALGRNGGVLLALWLLDTIGGLALMLFFLSLPYVMGSAFGIAAAQTGRLLPPPSRETAEAPENGTDGEA